MIKLKLNREQLGTLCALTNPSEFEKRAEFYIKIKLINALDTVFNIAQVGEMVAKKYLFSNSKTYQINLKPSEAASLLKLTYDLELLHDPLSYEINLAVIIRTELQNNLTNYQPQFNGHTNTQCLTIGGDSSFRKALTGSARSIGRGTD